MWYLGSLFGSDMIRWVVRNERVINWHGRKRRLLDKLIRYLLIGDHSMSYIYTSVESCLYISRAIGNNLLSKGPYFRFNYRYVCISAIYFDNSIFMSKFQKRAELCTRCRYSKLKSSTSDIYSVSPLENENTGRLDDTLSRYVLSNSLQTSDFRLPCILPNIGMLRSQVLKCP